MGGCQFWIGYMLKKPEFGGPNDPVETDPRIMTSPMWDWLLIKPKSPPGPGGDTGAPSLYQTGSASAHTDIKSNATKAPVAPDRHGSDVLLNGLLAAEVRSNTWPL